jgi:hypothetical protein
MTNGKGKLRQRGRWVVKTKVEVDEGRGELSVSWIKRKK